MKDTIVEWLTRNMLTSLACMLLVGLATGAAGLLVFGPDYKSRIAVLEAQVDKQERPMQVMVQGDQIVVGDKPIARFSQTFTMADLVLPLANGQILTFFYPEVTVEYQSGGQDLIESLNPPDFNAFIDALNRNARENPETWGDEMAPLYLKPDKLREMLKAAEEREAAASK